MAVLAKNTVFKISDMAGSPVFTQVTGVTEIAWDGVKWDTEETTSHDDATPVKTMQPTLYSNGNINLTILYSETNPQHTALRALSLNGAANDFQMIQVDSGEDATFEGFVTAFNYETPVGGLKKAKVTISVNGAFEID